MNQPKGHFLLVPLLLAAFFVQAASAWRLKAPTYDEPTHLAAGWTYLVERDFRLNVEHPPLLKQWAALPLLTMGLGEADNYYGWEDGHQGTFAHYFFYEGQDFDRMFFAARLAMIALATLLGLWIYLWSRQLWGPAGGLLSLLLFAFSPNLIAHSGIVGTDYGLASFGLLSLWTWSRMLERPSWGRCALAAVAAALTLLTKFSAVIFIPIWAGWWVIAVLSRGCWPGGGLSGLDAGSNDALSQSPNPDAYAYRPTRRFIATWAGRFGLMTLIIGLIVLADYGFQVRPAIEGFGSFFQHAGVGHHTFFRGEVSHTGWWSYFPVTYLIKTPLPELLMIALAMGVWLKQRRGWGPWALLAAPWIYFLLVASFGRVFIGYRHILPMVPLGLVMAGAVTGFRRPARRQETGDPAHPLPPTPSPSPSPRTPARSKTLAPILIGVICLWQVSAGLRVYPHHLTYFNELIGGPRNGWKWLSDSNIDWGQDLTTLADWMEESETPWVYLAYFGTADVGDYGIRYRRLPGYNMLVTDPMEPFNPRNPAPGVYAIFVTNLGGQYLGDPDTYRWFREREPDARLGNSVFVYRVP